MEQGSQQSSPKGFITLAGQRLTYTIRRNNRARRIWIKVEDREGLVLVFPKWAKTSQAPDLIRKHRDWILGRIEQRAAHLASAPPPLGEGRTVSYRGRALPLRVRNCACVNPSVEIHRDSVVVRVPRDREAPVGEVLAAFYREKAKEVFARRVQALAEAIGVKPKRVSVRDQKTRWGACTGRGTLTFNWRLLLAPPAVLDYVVVHELFHLRHANHGRRFWELVASHSPNFEAHRDWLRTYGRLLTLG